MFSVLQEIKVQVRDIWVVIIVSKKIKENNEEPFVVHLERPPVWWLQSPCASHFAWMLAIFRFSFQLERDVEKFLQISIAFAIQFQQNTFSWCFKAKMSEFCVIQAWAGRATCSLKRLRAEEKFPCVS